jgi:hypothetical protein
VPHNKTENEKGKQSAKSQQNKDSAKTAKSTWWWEEFLEENDASEGQGV